MGKAPDAAGTRGLYLELRGCSSDVLTDPEALRALAIGLWGAAMNGDGAAPDPLVTRLGTGAGGYSVVQLSWAASVLVHTLEAQGTAFVNVFSHDGLDIGAAERFATEFLASSVAVRERLGTTTVGGGQG